MSCESAHCLVHLLSRSKCRFNLRRQNSSTCDVALRRVDLTRSAFLSSCSFPAVSSASSLQTLVKATTTGGCMSLGSPAEIVTFKCFRERRQRLHLVPAASVTIVTPAPTVVGSARSDKKPNDDS